MTTLFAAGLAFALAFVPPDARGGTQDADPAAHEWSQARGVAAGTSRIDVAPITAEPVVAWKQTFRQVDSDPVCWGGVVYVVGTQNSGRKLYALDLATGSQLATPFAVLGAGRIHLAAWQGFVAAIGSDGITVYQHHAHELRASREKKIAGAFSAPGCLAQGYLFACDDRDKVVCVDVRTGKKLGAFPGGSGRPTVVPGRKPGELLVATLAAGTRENYAGTYLGLSRTRAYDLTDKNPEFDALEAEWYGSFEASRVSGPDLAGAFLAPVRAVTGKEDAKALQWIGYSPMALKATNGGENLHSFLSPKWVAPIATEPAVFDEFALGFGADGSLVTFRSDGRHAFVIPKGQALPPGARRGTCTVARNVLYLENWAVEIQGGRVLWCKPDLDPATALFPVGDGLALYTTKGGDLVCLKDPAPGTGSSLVAARPSAPGSGDGVVTADGRRIEGKITELGGGRIRVDVRKGAPVEFAAADVALVESGSTSRSSGDPFPLYEAFFAAIGADVLDSLDRMFEGYRRGGFQEECRRLLEETRAYDPAGSTATELEKRLGGVSTSKSSNAAAQLERMRKEEAQTRETLASAFARASAWTRDHGATLAASALLLDAHRVQPGRREVESDAVALVPKGFPPEDRGGGALAWLRLAKEVLPVSGEVLAPADEAWAKVRSAPWAANALGLRTKSLNLFSTESDPAVVGALLRRGERAVRILTQLFAEARADRPGPGDSSPLQVIVHKDREEYLSASAEAGHPGQEWTAGFFSISECLSRFYVPRAGKGATVLDRDLDHVLVHELCHHFVHQRWLGTGEHAGTTDPDRQGFWIVEGLAEFIADQVVEMDRRGERFDDETVLSIDFCARLLEAGKLTKVGDLLALSQKGFLKLGLQPLADVQLRHRIARAIPDAKNVFYEESASLVFFLVNRAGPERRAAAIRYIAKWYANGLDAASAKDLGYASAEELETAYFAFLRESGH